MRPLTHQEWEEHFVELRPYVIQEWPEIDPDKLESVGPDWDWLVQVVQDETGLPADEVMSRLRTLEAEELGISSGGAGEDEDAEGQASLALLRMSGEFNEAERPRILERLDKLNRRLKKFPADGTDLHLTVKDRDSTGQKITLEAWLPNFGHIAATSTESDLRAALMDVREDLWRQIDDAVNRRKGV
jgi:ribosome-associated translation inhibitor RaiA